MISLHTDPSASSVFVSVAQLIVAAILGIVTLFYLRETRRISLENRRPSLGIEPHEYLGGGGFLYLKLRNTGGLAKDLRIDLIEGDKTTKLYSPSLSRNGYIFLTPDIRSASDSGGKVVVKVKYAYRDIKMRESSVDFEIDFGVLKSEGRGPAYQTESLDAIAGTLDDIRRDNSFDRLRSR